MKKAEEALPEQPERWRMAVVVTAPVYKAGTGHAGLSPLPGGCKKLRKIGGEGGYSGHLVEWVADWLQVLSGGGGASQTNDAIRAVALPVEGERPFAWLNHSRRLSKSDERLTWTDETWIAIAMARMLSNRLA